MENPLPSDGHPYNPVVTGLNASQVALARKRYGENLLSFKKHSPFLEALKALFTEPMVILLVLISAIYFFSGQKSDGIFLLVAIIFVSAISLFQHRRTQNALAALQKYTKPAARVLRDGKTVLVNSEQLVVGDSIVLEEGDAVPADATLLQANDFSVDESVLTGESMAVFKDQLKKEPFVFMGTTVASGHAIATITAIGNRTRLGQIGKSIESIKEEETPLARQIKNFVKKMVVAGVVAFCTAWAFNYYDQHDLMQSLLRALTMAMSILPEEIPVAFATFMALGAWRLMKEGIIAKKMRTVETLGSATVICVDKTGTITENRMALAEIFVPGETTRKVEGPVDPSAKKLIEIAMWASEPAPFDPMEIALHNAYEVNFLKDQRPDYHLAHEYPLGGSPPMMTHVFMNGSGKRIIAAKGAPEAILHCCQLPKQTSDEVLQAVKEMGTRGLRVLGVAASDFEGKILPAEQQEIRFNFVGLVAFYDPPKPNIAGVLQDFYKAGIAVKIITGDNEATTKAIARQIGFTGYQHSISGEELIALDDRQLQKIVKEVHVFTRMFPLAKLRIIKALKASGEIVAMTGDGVNDGPALKAAHIGIAMGTKGTEIAKQAAALILIEDDLSKMVYAIAMGRRIYANLKKAIQYIISIHIPIILVVLLPLMLHWVYPNILLPIHVIILELIMGPTCSIVFENEPNEKDSMVKRPRPFSQTFFNWKELGTSLVQGLMIALGSMATYWYAVEGNAGEPATRTMVFTTLVSANLVLTLCNRSFYYSVLTTLKLHNPLMPLAMIVTVLLTGFLFYLPPVAHFFGFVPLATKELLVSAGIGAASVLWFEGLKWYRRLANKQ